jgi:transcriptional regulator with XRE-family HTH domain
MDINEYKAWMLSNKKFQKAYEKYDLGFEVGRAVIKARVFKGISQEKLAKLVETKQPSIARIENGKSLPSLRFLAKLAKAMGTYLLAPRFAFLETKTALRSITANEIIPIPAVDNFDLIDANISYKEPISYRTPNYSFSSLLNEISI